MTASTSRLDRTPLAWIVSFALAACARTPPVAQPPTHSTVTSASPAPSASASASPAPSSSSPPPPSAEEIAVDAALHAAGEAYAAGHADEARASLEQARSAAAGRNALLDRVALLEAAFRVEQNDLAGAIAIVRERVEIAAREDVLREFSLHDTMIFLREASDDPLGAYLEAEAMRSAADLPSVEPHRRTRIRLGYTWQRAHTLRNLAETSPPAQRANLIAYAEAARALFSQLAHEQNRSFASIDVLEEQFATLDGRTADALAAAGRLDLASLDSQDLYLTLRTYLAAHDEAGVARVRERFDADHSIDLFTSVYRRMARQALDRAAPSSAPPPRTRTARPRHTP